MYVFLIGFLVREKSIIAYEIFFEYGKNDIIK